MNRMQKGISILLCACMLLGVSAFGEEAVVSPTTAASTEEHYEGDGHDHGIAGADDFADDELLATVNGDAVTWGDAKEYYESLVSYYGEYYDMTDMANKRVFRAYALQNAIVEKLILQEVVKQGFDQMSDEERAAANATADAEWQTLLDSYIADYFPDLTEESSAEEKAAAKASAEAYFLEGGYTADMYRESYLDYLQSNKLRDMVIQDVTVTDADVEADYQAKVAADKELYENDLSGYIAYNDYVEQMGWYAMMSGTTSELEPAWYKPAGFRAVKHILLPVEDDLMATYKELQAALEEQMNAEEGALSTQEGTMDAEASAIVEDALAVYEEEKSAEEAVAADATSETSEGAEEPKTPVTQADVDAAKANILASLADKVNEINQKLADGVDFDTLIAEYGVNADGTATDEGMNMEPYKTEGYEVAAESANYVPEFVEASFSVDGIGDVSAPYLSDYGVHIVKYIGDVPAGPITMSAEERENRRSTLLGDLQNEVYYAQIDKWFDEADIVYTGLILSMQQLEDMSNAEVEEQDEMVAEGMGTEEQAGTQDTPVVDDEVPSEGE